METVVMVLAAGLAFLHPVPQVLRILRTDRVEGVSSASTMLGIVVATAWIAYGVARDLPVVTVLSVVFLVGYCVTTALLWQRGRRSGAALAAGLGVGFVLLTLVGGWTALGVALGGVAAAQYAPQVIEANRSADLSGLAPGTYVVCFLDAVVWGGYGLLVADGPLMLYGVIMLGVASGVLVPWARWRSRTAAVATA